MASRPRNQGYDKRFKVFCVSVACTEAKHKTYWKQININTYLCYLKSIKYCNYFKKLLDQFFPSKIFYIKYRLRSLTINPNKVRNQWETKHHNIIQVDDPPQSTQIITQLLRYGEPSPPRLGNIHTDVIINMKSIFRSMLERIQLP